MSFSVDGSEAEAESEGGFGSAEGPKGAHGVVDEPGWEVEPGEDVAAVAVAIGRQVKLWREAAGLTAAEFGAAIGYSENMVFKVESGKRIPKPEFLEQADDVLRADGKIAAMKQDAVEARYPKKVRELKTREAEAIEVGLYSNAHLHGLLQTPDYARALLETRRPQYMPERLEQLHAARMARHAIFERSPAPDLSFVQEEATLRRPIGGTMVLRRELEHMLRLAQLRNVDIQVMPMSRANHPGTGGIIELFKFDDGTAVARCDDEFNGRAVSDQKQVRILDLRYSIIRAQALTSEESIEFIKKILGEE